MKKFNIELAKNRILCYEDAIESVKKYHSRICTAIRRTIVHEYADCLTPHKRKYWFPELHLFFEEGKVYFMQKNGWLTQTTFEEHCLENGYSPTNIRQTILELCVAMVEEKIEDFLKQTNKNK